MDLPRRRSPSEVLRRGYSDEELGHLYELGRFFLENGDIRRAEVIITGVTEVAPEFAPAWLAMAYIHIHNKNMDGAIFAARQALRVDPHFVEAILYLATCLLTTGDLNSAGTYLGEVGEMIEGGTVEDANVVRFYKAQLARFQSR
ncbi:MAG: Tetratricopeptide repeat [Pseudomonadota bacterium]|jgi:Tfp pilus assembly protein PilF